MTQNRRGLRARLWHTVLPIVLLAASFAGIFLYHGDIVEKAQESLFLSRRALTVQYAAAVRAALSGVSDGLAGFAASALTPEAAVLAASTAAEALGLDALLVADADGNVVGGGGAERVAEASFFPAAMAGSTVLLPGGDGFPADSLVAAVPLTEADGSPAGVVAGVLGPAQLRRVLSEAPSPDSLCTLLCDGEGRILALTGEADGLAEGSGLLAALAGADGLVHYVLNGADRYAVYAPLGIGDWMVVAVLPGALVSGELEAAVGGGYAPLGAAAALSLLVPVFIIYLSGRRRRKLEDEKARIESSDNRFRLALQNTAVTIRDYDHKTRTLTRIGSTADGPVSARLIPSIPDSIPGSGEVHPDDAERCVAMYRALLGGAPRAEAVFRIRAPGEDRWVYERVVYTNLFDDNGRPLRSIGLSEDVTERYEERQHYERELAFQQLIARDVYTTAAVNVTKRRIERLGGVARAQAPELLGAEIEQLFRRGAAAVAEDEDVCRFFATLTAEALEERFRRGQTTILFDYLRRFPDGGTRWVRDETHLLRDPDTGDLIAFTWLRDITEEKQRAKELERAAETDSMTGLYSHDAVLNHIARYLEMEGSAGIHALYMLDIDDFKSVNDTFGHAAGDACIQTLVSHIRRLFRANDILGRLGGDEFLILMKNTQSEETVRRRARELVQTLRFSCDSPDGRRMSVTVSVGAALIEPGAAPDITALRTRIDEAMYRAKRLGKNRYYLAGSAPEEAEEPPLSPPAAGPGFDEARCRAALSLADALLWQMDLRTGRLWPPAPEAEPGAAIPAETLPETGLVARESAAVFADMLADIRAGSDSRGYPLSVRRGEEFASMRANYRLLRDAAGRPYFAVGVLRPEPPA